MSKSVIRIAKPEDAEELLKIYAPYVKHTALTRGCSMSGQHVTGLWRQPFMFGRMGEKMELEECCMRRWRKFYRNRIY